MRKTTTLRIIGGFEYPTKGYVFEVKINDLPPYKRQINTVFQNMLCSSYEHIREYSFWA